MCRCMCTRVYVYMCVYVYICILINLSIFFCYNSHFHFIKYQNEMIHLFLTQLTSTCLLLIHLNYIIVFHFQLKLMQVLIKINQLKILIYNIEILTILLHIHIKNCFLNSRFTQSLQLILSSSFETSQVFNKNIHTINILDLTDQKLKSLL